MSFDAENGFPGIVCQSYQYNADTVVWLTPRLLMVSNEAK